jgi:hypothetical protein
VVVMVSGYSRVIAARTIPSRRSPDLLAGHWSLISDWGRVPRALACGGRRIGGASGGR